MQEQEDLGGQGKVLHARQVGAGVMDALRGEPPPDDPSASPSKRLEAQMRSGDGTVPRSPEQLRASSSKLEAEA